MSLTFQYLTYLKYPLDQLISKTCFPMYLTLSYSHEKPDTLRYVYGRHFNQGKGNNQLWVSSLAKAMVHQVFPFAKFVKWRALDYHLDSKFVICSTTSQPVFLFLLCLYKGFLAFAFVGCFCTDNKWAQSRKWILTCFIADQKDMPITDPPYFSKIFTKLGSVITQIYMNRPT